MNNIQEDTILSDIMHHFVTLLRRFFPPFQTGTVAVVCLTLSHFYYV